MGAVGRVEIDSPSVFVVEDDSAAIRLYEEVSRDLDDRVTVTVVTDGRRALDVLHGRDEYADSGLPGLVVLDLDLPGIGGREACGRCTRSATSPR